MSARTPGAASLLGPPARKPRVTVWPLPSAPTPQALRRARVLLRSQRLSLLDRQFRLLARLLKLLLPEVGIGEQPMAPPLLRVKGNGWFEDRSRSREISLFQQQLAQLGQRPDVAGVKRNGAVQIRLALARDLSAARTTPLADNSHPHWWEPACKLLRSASGLLRDSLA